MPHRSTAAVLATALLASALALPGVLPAQATSRAVRDSLVPHPTRDSARTLAPVVTRTDRVGRARYVAASASAALRTGTPLHETPQSVTVVGHALIADQAMQGMADVVRYVPGVTMASGEGNRDQPTIRGNATSADFFLDGIRDDAQYYRDLYNVDRVEALKGANAMAFGRGGGGGVINRVTKEAAFGPFGEISVLGGSFGDKRFAADTEGCL